MANVISKFCNIGIAALHCSVGLQANHKETEYEPYQVLDEYSSGCLGCPFYAEKQQFSSFPESEPFKAAQDACDRCDHRCYTTAYRAVDTYVNETNRYGKAERLPFSALLLYLLLHFMAPDNNGIIKHASTKWAAQTLGVTVRTIMNNLQRLTSLGYICTSNTDTDAKGYMHILITNYKDIYKKASEGGRGYITFSDELFAKLLKIGNINLLRITLKNLLEIEKANTPTQATATINKTFGEMRGYLPDYCKPNVISRLLDKETEADVFESNFEGYGYSFTINDKYYCKQVKKDQLQQNTELLDAAVSAINEASQSDGKTLSPAIHEIFGVDLLAGTALTTKYPQLILDSSQLKSIATISLQYGLQATLAALGRLYTDYICAGKKVQNPGGLIRTLCQKSQNHLGIA